MIINKFCFRNTKIKIFLITIFFLFALPCFSQKTQTTKINPQLLTGRWSAFWINHPMGSPVSYGVVGIQNVTATAYTMEASAVRFSLSGKIEAINGSNVSGGSAEWETMDMGV